MAEIDDIAAPRTASRRSLTSAAPAARLGAIFSAMLGAILGAVLLSACAQSSPPDPINSAQAAIPQGDARTCRPDPALLAPQSEPDCVFRRAELKTMDPEQWARLKIEYERQCYQRAERTVRDRLNRLQGVNRCES